MKKLIFLMSVLSLLFCSSCLSGGGSAGTSSSDYTGVLTVYDAETNEVTYTDEEATVTVCIPNIIEPKFNIVFNGIKFSPLMPVKLNIEVEGIKFTSTVSEDETSINHIFDATNIVPTVGGVEYDKYTIDRIWGCVGKEVEINFTMESKSSRVHFLAKPFANESVQ